MIELSNGYRFSVAAASGALAYGRGWWFDRWLWGPLGFVKPARVTVITKTLTAEPRLGNLRMWAPWRAVRPFCRSGACVNAVGLTNPGIDWWQSGGYWTNYPTRGVIVSVKPDDVTEAAHMGYVLATMDRVVGVELNASCPNVASLPGDKVRFVDGLYNALSDAYRGPVGVKLGFTDPYREICRELDGRAAWFDLINTVPWSVVYPFRPSPLSRQKHGQSGGVSGSPIIGFARKALTVVKDTGIETPILSGGGIMTPEEAVWRLEHGASAVSLGTVYLTRPWRVNRIIDAVEAHEKERTCQTKS